MSSIRCNRRKLHKMSLLLLLLLPVTELFLFQHSYYYAVEGMTIEIVYHKPRQDNERRRLGIINDWLDATVISTHVQSTSSNPSTRSKSSLHETTNINLNIMIVPNKDKIGVKSSSKSSSFFSSTKNNDWIQYYFYKSSSKFRTISPKDTSYEIVWHGTTLKKNDFTNKDAFHNSRVPQSNVESNIFNKTVMNSNKRQQQIQRYNNSNNRKLLSTQTQQQNHQQLGFTTIYERFGQVHAATFTTQDVVYELIYHSSTQQYRIRATNWSDYPSEIQKNYTTSTMNGRSTASGSDSNFQRYRTGLGHNQYVSSYPNSLSQWTTTSGPSAIRPIKIKSISSRLGTATTTTTATPVTHRFIDVLVVVTNRALCEYSGIYTNNNCIIDGDYRQAMDSALRIAEADTNNALKHINATIRIVQTMYYKDRSYDPIADLVGLNSITSNNEIQLARNTYGADLVSIIVGTNLNCGIAVVKGYRSIIAQSCLGQYTFSHEIGHNLGGNHNREAYNTTNHQYAYGYRNINPQNINSNYRTFIAYECNDKNTTCARIPYYSTSEYTLPDGRILGDLNNDNLHNMKEFALTVSRWRNESTKAPSKVPVSTASPTQNPMTTVPSKVPTRRPSFRPSLFPTKTLDAPAKIPTIKPISVSPIMVVTAPVKRNPIPVRKRPIRRRNPRIDKNKIRYQQAH